MRFTQKKRIDPRGLGTQLSSAASPNQVIKINAHVQCYPAKTFHEKSRLLIYDSLFRHTHIVGKLTFLGVQRCGCVGIGYPRKKVVQSQSLKNGSILYEDSESHSLQDSHTCHALELEQRFALSAAYAQYSPHRRLRCRLHKPKCIKDLYSVQARRQAD